MVYRNPRVWLTVTGISLSLFAAWSLRYFSGIEPLTALTQNYAQAGLGQIGLQATDAIMIGHDRGHRQWRMTARTITISRDRRSLTVDGIHQGVFYDDREQPLVSITAAHAVWQTPFGALGLTNTGTLRLEGGILATVLTPDRPLLQSQTLIWDPFAHTLTSPGPIKAALPRLTVTAGTALYTLPATVPGLLQGTLHLNTGIQALFRGTQGTAELNCPGLDWDARQNSASTRGPVAAHLPGSIATANDIEANTKTGNLTGHGFRGTLLLSTEVQ